MSDPNRTMSNNNETGLHNSIYGSPMNINHSLAAMSFMNNNAMNANYQMLMRLSEMSSKTVTGSPALGYGNIPHGNYLQPLMSNLSSPALTNSTNNDLINSFNWATALQYSELVNGASCGPLNNGDSNTWSPSLNSEQAWKTIQNLYLDFYNPVAGPQINNNHNFQTPINIHPYSQCDSQESFNDVLAKLGHGLNAAKKREEESLPDLIKDPIIQSSIGNKNFDCINERSSATSSNYDTVHSEYSHDISLGLQSSYFSKSQTKDFSRNSSPVFNRNSSINQGRGRGRPPKSNSSRSYPPASDLKIETTNFSNVFEKPSIMKANSPLSAPLIDVVSITSPSCSTSTLIKNNVFVTSHVSSKLVIPPTVSSVSKNKLNLEGNDNDGKLSTSSIKKNREETSLKVHSKKTSSTSSIEGTIEDVLKSFQGMHNLPINSISSNLLTSLTKTVSEVSSAEDLTNGKKRHSKNISEIEKREKNGEQITPSIYLKPLKKGWTRKTYLKSLTELIGNVEYESPSSQRSTSIVVLKEILVNEKINNLSIEHFSFDITLRLGDYLKPSFNNIMGFEKLSTSEVEILFDRKLDKKDICQGSAMNDDSKKLANYQRKVEGKVSRNYLKTEKDIIKQKKEQKLLEAHISKELKKPVEDLRLLNCQSMPNFDEIQGNRLCKKSFSNCLLVSEFLYSFADVLGIDAETIPTMNDYQKAFVDRNPESLHIICWLLTELLKFAVCDPGITNTKLITQVIGVKFSDLEVNLSTLTGVLRAFILARAIGNESEMESWLIDIDYKELPGEKQATLLGFVVNEMLSSRLISCEVDKILDQQSFIRRDKWILDGKLRRLKLIQSRRLCCSNGTTNAININSNDGQVVLETDCCVSPLDGDSDLDSIDSNDNMTSSQMNWSGEEDETASCSSFEDFEKHIEKLNNQVLQKKQDLNHGDLRLRGIFLGQDRFFRNYYLLRHLGGIYIDSAPDNLHLSLDPDSIVERINSIYAEKQIQSDNYEEDQLVIENVEINKLGTFMPLLPQLSNEESLSPNIKPEHSLFNEMPNLNPQLEPLDLRLTGCSDDHSYDTKHQIMYKIEKSEINNKNLKSEWNVDIIDSATTLYANRAQYIYPEIEFEQLKSYYRQQLEDYLRECNQGNAMEHLKSWVSFYQIVLKNERMNGEVIQPFNKNAQSIFKNDRIKDLAEKELEKMNMQSQSNTQEIPFELKGNWNWIRNEEKLKGLISSLHMRGLRERHLSKSIERHYDLIISSFKQDISIAFNYNSQRCPTKLRVRSKRGKGRGNSHNHQSFTKVTLSQSIASEMKLTSNEQSDVFLAEVAALEKVEDLITTVVTASLYKKGWKYPERVVSDDTIKVISSTAPKQFNFEMYPLDLGKERLLELEDQLERRYLLPPLNWEFKPKLSINVKENNLKKTLDEVVSSSCGFEDAADSSSSFIDESRSLSPQTNLIISDFDGKNDKEFKSEISDLKETPLGLVTWRKSVLECSNDEQLLNCMKILSNAIAWDKSIMKVLCQICRKDCNEAQLLLCDSCDQGYHTYCFRPPLACIPEGQWFCHDCVSKATEQKLCYVCGQLKTARTMICISCKRMLHAACAKPPITRVPRKWICHNCSGKTSSDEGSNITNLKNLPTLTICLNNYAESNSCPNSNSSNTNSDFNLLCKQSSSSSISSNNILLKKRSCKRVLEPQSTSIGSKKKTKPSSTDTKSNKVFTLDYVRSTKEVSFVKDDKSFNSELFDIETIKSKLKDLSIVPNDCIMSQVDFDLSRHFLLNILDEEFVHPFLCPVDLRKVPIYKKVIRNPMDLGSIAKKLSDYLYTNVEEFTNDIRLIFTNCEEFNEDNSEVGKAGHALRAYFYHNWNLHLETTKEADDTIVADI